MKSQVYLPHSQACENNKEAIFETINPYLLKGGALLEVGSGTGQHGAFMAPQLPNLTWQSSDRVEYHSGIKAWVAEAKSPRFLEPFELDVNTFNPDNLEQPYDYMFTANTLHIMSWSEVERLFALIPKLLNKEGAVFVYGPFNYNGTFTSESNARFNEWLFEQGRHMAIRDFEAVNELALNNGLRLANDHTMPANNRLLVWNIRD